MSVQRVMSRNVGGILVQVLAQVCLLVGIPCQPFMLPQPLHEVLQFDLPSSWRVFVYPQLIGP
jgi:hypothetical protein